KDLVDDLAPVPCAWLPPDSDLKIPEYRALAVDTVRYVGDGVAAVVAASRYQARDAADAIEVEYEMLPAIVDQEKATHPGAPQLYADVPNNTAFVWRLAGGDVEAALQEADVVVSQRLVNHRLIPNAMEPRAAVADYNPG